ncbi:GNAT family N-acetyltransferase [Arthrobacter sp. CJ23]|uniref:GNAT family N-acetyltransferase n=1 Tax=Arthrobacter sp. CJ23 TaxID=2972479 RepID=UPI00215CBC1E|nr:GNAT family N-acetyltransferase [Arthrobacter sp. CJ23]UVJ38578.1 GNAT family N-acetyltransferase [Arthrobacter sp. CJ23]
MTPTSNPPQLKGLEIARIAIPAEPDTAVPETAVPAAFRAFHELNLADELEVWGNLDRCATLAESLTYWRGSPYEERQAFLAMLDGVPVGRCSLTLPLSENTDEAGIGILVASGHRRQGIGTAMLVRMEGLARERGRTVFDSYRGEPIGSFPAGAPELAAKSGTGGVPCDAASTGFAVRHGYSLEQVETTSLLPLPVPSGLLSTLDRDALERAGGYSVLLWQDRCPEDVVAAYAALKSLMTTEVPIAGLGWEGEHWDVARVRAEEDTWGRSGIESLVAVARHDTTGELAAYTVLNHREALPGIVNQEDTLVAPGHRGHRLGMVVKIANLRRAQLQWPGAKSVMTWNASENRHMLAINIALGFRPAGIEGEWQKRLE